MMAVLAPALVNLRNEINARWPHRDRRTDGWIGDRAHQATHSDHNPNQRNVVDAIDIDVDGISCPLVVAAAIRHPSTNYVIWNRHIWSKKYLGSDGLPRQRTYTGSNPHTDHIHVSVKQSVTDENRTTKWGLAPAAPAATPKPKPQAAWYQRLAAALPVVRKGSPARKTNARVQALLGNLVVDGDFGPKTDKAVRAFQQGNSLAVDGVVGPKTWAVLIGTLPTLRRPCYGEMVRRLQALLGPNGVKVAVDRDFGPATEKAVDLVQRRYGLEVDGIVGPKTWTALLTR